MEDIQNTFPESSPQKTSCSNCTENIAIGEVFCPNCGFPENGTEKERNKFESRINAKKNLLREVEREVKRGRNTLIFLGILNGLAGLYYGFILEEIAVCVAQIIVAIIYLVLSTWVKKQPFGALLSALILYLTIVLLLAVIEPISLASGIVWKIVIIGFLVKGIKSGHETRNIYRELEDLGIKSK